MSADMIGAATHVFNTHPLSVSAAVLVFANLVWLTARMAVSKAQPSRLVDALKGLPYLKLGQAPEANSEGEIKVFWMMYAFIFYFNVSVWDIDGRRGTRESPIPIIEHRFPLLVFSLFFQTSLFYFAKSHIVHALPKDQIDAQAANVVRVTVKLGLMFYTALCGNWYRITTAHPGDLTDEDFSVAYWGPLGMSVLYTWELCFRDLKPVNFIHHGASLMAAWSVLEWYADDVQGNTVRKFTPVGTVMSFTEGWCCLGNICYRYASRRVASRVMLADAAFVAVAYNLIAGWWIWTIASNWDTFDDTSRYVSCPLVLCLTYPAQMNMVRVFYILHRKSAALAKKEAREGLSVEPQRREEVAVPPVRKPMAAVPRVAPKKESQRSPRMADFVRMLTNSIKLPAMSPPRAARLPHFRRPILR